MSASWRLDSCPARLAAWTRNVRLAETHGKRGFTLQRHVKRCLPGPLTRAATMPVVTAQPHGPGSAYRLTEEQAMLRDAVRVLADEQIAPRAAEIDRTAEFPQDVRELLAAHDILALPFAERLRRARWRAPDAVPRHRADQSRLRHERPDPRRPGARRAADPPRRHRRAAGTLAPGPRGRPAADRVRADGGRGGLGRRRDPDACHPRRRRLRHRRLEAVHQPRLGGRPDHGLRA